MCLLLLLKEKKNQPNELQNPSIRILEIGCSIISCLDLLQVAASMLKVFSKSMAGSLTGRERSGAAAPQGLAGDPSLCQKQAVRSVHANGSFPSVISLLLMFRIIPTAGTFHPKGKKKHQLCSKVALYRVLLERSNSQQNNSGKGSHSKVTDWKDDMKNYVVLRMNCVCHVMENFFGNNKNITSLPGDKVSDVILQSSRGQT